GSQQRRADGVDREHDRSRALGAGEGPGRALRRLRDGGSRGSGGRCGRWRGGGRGGADRVRRRAPGPRREEDPGNKGRQGRDRPRPERGEGPRRRGPEPRQGSPEPRGRRGSQDPARRRRCLCGVEV
ncbi:MAG: LSU ribosomal protein L7p/L12p (P1/P2), partial [uncultured Rubrobacteraceae bacterium]